MAPGIRTRSGNTSKRPGIVDKPATRRTSAQVKADKAAVAAAKEVLKLAQQAGINRAAAFEVAARANEDALDATPRPVFTPKPKSAGTVPASDTEYSESNDDGQTFVLPADSVTEEDSVLAEDAEETPMPKRKIVSKAGKGKKKAEVVDLTGSSASESESDRPPPPPKKANKKAAKASSGTQQQVEVVQKKKKKTSGIREAIEATKVSTVVKEESKAPAASWADPAKATQQPELAAVSKGIEEPKGKLRKGKSKADIKVGSKCMGDGPVWQPEAKPAERKFVMRGPNFLPVDRDDLDWLMDGGDNGPDQSLSKKRSNGSSSEVEIVAESKPQAPAIKRCVSAFSTSPSTAMLTLNPTTLFYWNLSNPPAKKVKYSESQGIEVWSKTIPRSSKPPPSQPTSRAQSQTGTQNSFKTLYSSKSQAVTPSLTSGSTRSSVPTALTNKIVLSTEKTAALQIKPDPDASFMVNDNGLSDNDEMRGVEREAAVATPHKGKARLDSKVSFILSNMLIFMLINDIIVGSSS